MKIQSINPYTEEIVAEFNLLTDSQINKQIDNSKKAFTDWSQTSLTDRLSYIKKVAEVLRKNKRKYAETITKEMGKPIKESLAEVEKCAWLCDYYVENAENFLKPEIVKTEAKKSYVTFEPLGIVLSIMPWNYPFWQVFRFAIPTIIVGNVSLLKHASNVPISALEIESIFKEAGLPKNVFKTLLISSKSTMKLIEEDKVEAISLTGSNKAGSQVGALAGKQIKKVVLELGGSDPFIILDDANIDKAAEAAVSSRFINAGQSCVAAKRFIVMESVAKEFKNKFTNKLKQLKVGDPMDESTDIGPLAKKEFVEELETKLDDAKNKGANITLAENNTSKGFFFTPCIVSNTNQDMDVLTDETFGPIAPISIVKTEEEAITLANSSEYGLGASIWSKDTNKAEELAKSIQSGFVAINGMVTSDPRLPFGGIKKSGIGRELSHYGLKEFVNIKTIVVKE